jgi:hypothetical protein
MASKRLPYEDVLGALEVADWALTSIKIFTGLTERSAIPSKLKANSAITSLQTYIVDYRSKLQSEDPPFVKFHISSSLNVKNYSSSIRQAVTSRDWNKAIANVHLMLSTLPGDPPSLPTTPVTFPWSVPKKSK